MSTLLVIVLVLLLIGGVPYTGWHDRGWYPSGGIGLVLLILVILILAGRL